MSWVRVHLTKIMALLCARLSISWCRTTFQLSLAVVDSGTFTTFSVSIKQKLFFEAILNLDQFTNLSHGS